MKKIIITFIAAMCSLFATARNYHEILINAGGGLSTFNNDLSSGKPGCDFGIGYSCIFSRSVGIHVGAEIALYNSSVNLSGVKIVTRNLVDSEGDVFNMHTTLNKYQESHNDLFLNIPIMAKFQPYRLRNFFAMGGLKIGIPLSCNYQASNFTLINEAYYPDYNNWLTNQEFAGFGRFENINSKGEQNYNISIAFAFETGMSWELRYIALYAGLYFDYGLNNIASKSAPFVKYTNSEPAEFKTNRALISSTDINLMTIGVKVRVALIK